MNKNTGIVLGSVAAVVIIGIIFYATRNTSSSPSTNVTSDLPTPSVSTSTGQTATSQPSVPIVVTSANAIPTDTTVIVTGTVTPNGTFTNYWYEYGTTVNLGIKTPNQSIGSGYTSIAAPGYITGLTKDTKYYFRLVAENQYGRFGGTNYSFQTTHGNPSPVGSVPTVTTLAANGMTRTGVSLNGEVTSNKAATTYWFEYGKTPNLGNVSALVGIAATSVRLPTSISLTGLDPSTVYYFRLDAQNQFGTVNGAVLNFKTTGPVATTAPSATAPSAKAPSAKAPSATTRGANSLSTSTATLRGTVDPNGATTTYRFEYSTDSNFGGALLQTTDTTVISAGEKAVSASTKVSSLASSTLYYFRVVAQNTIGTIRGDSMSFKTK